LSAHRGAGICRWAKKNKAELCFTSTCASLANPIEVRFGPLRQFAIAKSNYPNHTVQTRPCTPTHIDHDPIRTLRQP
jgi:hypothetical protein